MHSSTPMRILVEKNLTQWIAEEGRGEDDDNDIKLGGRHPDVVWIPAL